MADLSDSPGFSMEVAQVDEVVKGTDVRYIGHTKVVEVMESIYSHSRYDQGTFKQAQMQVYACERFNAWMETHAGDFWASITSAVQDTLQRYPLEGNPPSARGFLWRPLK